MGNLIADIFVTCKLTYKRLPQTVRSLRSLIDNTDRDQYRLTVCFDGDIALDDDTAGIDCNSETVRNNLKFISTLAYGHYNADYVLQSSDNEGLGPTINRAIAHIKSINDWYSDPKAGKSNQVAPYIVMCQDDLVYTKDWLPILTSRFIAYGMQYKLGFASGVECIEHPMKKDLGGGVILKDWIRASQMLATREYWESLMPIPRFDPETGRARAKPNDGMGSGVDWWLIRNHGNSVCKTGRTCLVIPGLVQHAGYKSSTWLQDGREMPESEADKDKINGT